MKVKKGEEERFCSLCSHSSKDHMMSASGGIDEPCNKCDCKFFGEKKDDKVSNYKNVNIVINESFKGSDFPPEQAERLEKRWQPKES